MKDLISPSQEYKDNRAKAERDGKLSKYQYFWLAIPASCDLCATGLQFMGLLLVPASVWQMLRGGMIVIVAIVSVLFLNRKLYRHHILGLTLVIIGISLIGVAAITDSSGSSESGDDG